MQGCKKRKQKKEPLILQTRRNAPVKYEIKEVSASQEKSSEDESVVLDDANGILKKNVKVEIITQPKIDEKPETFRRKDFFIKQKSGKKDTTSGGLASKAPIHTPPGVLLGTIGRNEETTKEFLKLHPNLRNKCMPKAPFALNNKLNNASAYKAGLRELEVKPIQNTKNQNPLRKTYKFTQMQPEHDKSKKVFKLDLDRGNIDSVPIKSDSPPLNSAIRQLYSKQPLRQVNRLVGVNKDFKRALPAFPELNQYSRPQPVINKGIKVSGKQPIGVSRNDHKVNGRDFIVRNLPKNSTTVFDSKKR